MSRCYSDEPMGRLSGQFSIRCLTIRPMWWRPISTADSHMDIAIADDIRYTSSPMLYVALGDGSGRLQRYTPYTLPSRGNSIAVADFNEDGKPDLAFASDKDTEGIGVLLGNGDGSFYRTRLYPNGGGARWAHVGAFNGDGHADILFLTDTAANVLLGHGGGMFNPKPVISPVGDAGAFAVSDFDNNGVADIAISLFPNTLAVLLGDGTGRLNIFDEYQVGNPYDVAGVPVTADFNGDGFSDMAVPISGTRFVMSVQINSGVQ